MSTSVVTDTTAYMPDELIAEHGIGLISLHVTLDGEQRPESEIAAGGYDEFYERLRHSEQGPTTSQPSVGEFMALYEPRLADGGEVVSIHLSGGISGTCDSAAQAREQLIEAGAGGERVHILDSRTACGGQAMLVIAAARAAAAGAGGAEAHAAASRARDGLELWFALDTLEYLRRGGRIGAAKALIGSALNVKPILTVAEEVKPVTNVRTRRRAFERMVEFARERKESGANEWIVQHIQDPDTARAMVDECRQVFGTEPLMVSELGPVIGAHAGPGLIGFGAAKL